MMSELGGDAKIPDLWRMSAILVTCPKDVKEQMVGNWDEIHAQQNPAGARETERDTCADEGGPREWQRTRRGGLIRCGRGSKGLACYRGNGQAKGKGQDDEMHGKERLDKSG